MAEEIALSFLRSINLIFCRRLPLNGWPSLVFWALLTSSSQRPLPATRTAPRFLSPYSLFFWVQLRMFLQRCCARQGVDRRLATRGITSATAWRDDQLLLPWSAKRPGPFLSSLLEVRELSPLAIFHRQKSWPSRSNRSARGYQCLGVELGQDEVSIEARTALLEVLAEDCPSKRPWQGIG